MKILMEPSTLSILAIAFSLGGLAVLSAALFFRSSRIEKDLYASEKVVRTVSPTFHEAISKVRGEGKRRILYALDAVTKTVDRLVDHKDDPNGLEAFEKSLLYLIEKRSVDRTVLRSLKHIRRRLGKNYEFAEFFTIIGARKRDFEHKGFQTIDDLYSYGNDVHGASISVLVRPFAKRFDQRIKDCVEELGRAMTITRTLRMVGDDYRMERIHLPRNAMTKARYLSYELRHAVINDSFIALFEDLAKRAEADFDHVLERIGCFPRALRRMITYLAVTDKKRIEACRKDGYEVFYQNHELDRTMRERHYRKNRRKAMRKARDNHER
ncbi:MAG: squalene/phytoene synthase family protein [Acholeplasmataceae bacterium]